MKKNLLFWLAAIIAFSLTGLQSCKYKTDYQVPGSTVVYDNSNMVVASFAGQITDEAGTPMDAVTVSTSGYTTQTDANGFFYFNSINTPSHNTTIKASKTGFFNGFRSMMVKAGARHNVALSLMKKDNPQTFISTNGGTVNTGSGLSITFPAGSIVNKSTGLTYSGQVFVYAKRIDPTTNLGQNTMPGDLRGVATSQEENLLISYGMMVAELYDASGNALQIGNNQEATLSLDIPTSLAGTAPASIVLWYFDEAKGIWVEEGKAMLQGNKYVGTVKHFSFWNCDTPAAAIQLEMTLVDQNNNALSGYHVTLTNTANSDTRGGLTNSNGWVGGLVYPNATLTMNVYANSVCGSIPVYTQTVTTGAVAQNLGTVVINLTALSTSSITGSIIDCANNPISNASLLIMPLGIIITPNAAGVFNYSFPCMPTGTLTYYVYDLTNNVYGSSTGTIVSGVNNLGTLSACGNVAPFLNLTMTNTVTSVTLTKNFLAPADFITSMVDSAIASPTSTITASSSGTPNGSYFSFQAADSTIGTHVINYVSPYLGTGTFTDTQFTLTTGTVTYTSFPLFPGDVLGTFTMTLVGVPSGNTYTANGNFRAPRTN